MRSRVPRPHTTGVIAMLLAATFTGVVLANHGETARITTPGPHSSGPKTSTFPTRGRKITPFGPTALSEARLQNLWAALGRPLYWAGPARSGAYELSLEDDGTYVLRYLPADARPGSKQSLRTVTTRPVGNAFVAIDELARRDGMVSRTLGNGGRAVYASDDPTRIFLAFPDAAYQLIQVFDPVAGEVQRLVRSGEITALGS
ncbi:MAG: hypothetical protein WCJ67_11590 [Thermoleophilia bacterium]